MPIDVDRAPGTANRHLLVHPGGGSTRRRSERNNLVQAVESRSRQHRIHLLGSPPRRVRSAGLKASADPSDAARAGLPKLLVVAGDLEPAYVQGVWHLLRSRPGWKLLESPQTGATLDPRSGALPWADAFILAAMNAQTREAAAALPIPVVNLIEVAEAGSTGLLQVSIDNRAVGRMAFDHLQALGFQDFAYLPWEPGPDSVLRQSGFLAAAAEAGFADRTRVLPCFLSTTHWTRDLGRQAEIFRGLPRPCGLFCFADWLASVTLGALRLAGRLVPEDVAVVGVNNQEIVCESSHPALSSVDPNLRRVGFKAAEAALRAVEDPGAAGPVEVKVPPRAVVFRASSQSVAASDPDVAAAIRHVLEATAAEHFPDAEEVAAAVGLSRRHLDTKFQRELNRTVAAEVGRRRTALVLQLLHEGELPLVEIAIRSEYGSVSQVCRLVRRETGMTPQAYRRQAR